MMSPRGGSQRSENFHAKIAGVLIVNIISEEKIINIYFFYTF